MENKIGYKGFDKELACRGEKFEVGVVYSKQDTGRPLRCCTEQGYHYCNKIENVFPFYPITNGNRFCEIEILGTFKDEWDKSITTSFKIVKEVTEEIYKKKIHEDMRLKDVRELQSKYPHLHVGGSIGLFLHGIATKRVNEHGVTDIDMTTPYFTLIEGDEKNSVEEAELEEDGYGDDFDSGYFFNGIKLEMKIDPKQRYEIVEYDGFRYKVTALETIIDFKTKYAMKGIKKHKNDLYELLGKKYYPSTSENTKKEVAVLDDLPYL
jgi:uncharacterized protein YqgV (UPF0045/DUF77 family)